MKIEIPTCPSCKKSYTLVFVSTDKEPAPKFRCNQDAGGCGMYYYISDLPRLYTSVEMRSA